MLAHTPEEFLYLASLVINEVVILAGIAFAVLLQILGDSDEVYLDQIHPKET